MNLRTSKVLKYFAILLFSFEMIAPALIPAAEQPQDVYESESYTNATHPTNLISSLLFEENTGEEEERESKDKHTLYLVDLGFDRVFIQLGTAETRQTSWTEPHKKSASQPLFALFHSYLI
ncbi:MAG TPA: hypothetical protein VK508_20490 [Cyclobacteriaceae bacterium]|nr:hypothetical protein [Cyclobacteriaceae bacterium]